MASVIPTPATSSARSTVDVDAGLAEVVGDQPGSQPGRLARRRARFEGQTSDLARRWEPTPFGWPQAHDAPTLLIDQHGQAALAAQSVELLGERTQLRPVDTVALEQDDAGRLQREEQLALRHVERGASDADHRSARDGSAPRAQAHWAIGPTMKHWPPSARIAPQAFAAASRLENGPACSR